MRDVFGWLCSISTEFKIHDFSFFYFDFCRFLKELLLLFTAWFTGCKKRAQYALWRMAWKALESEKLKFHKTLSTSGLFFVSKYIVGIYLKLLHCFRVTFYGKICKKTEEQVSAKNR